MSNQQLKNHAAAPTFRFAQVRNLRWLRRIMAVKLILLGAWTQLLVAEETATKTRTVQRAESQRAVKALRAWLAQPAKNRLPLAEQTFAKASLSKADAKRAAASLWEAHAQNMRESRAEEMKARMLKHGDLEMPFDYKILGKSPASGRSLFISLHGGGGGPKQMNDGQWRNQLRLYQPAEGVYLCPRAPTDTWNLWHQPHIDQLFNRLIENLIVLENVNPDRVYIMGYSAGGDGVYQLAPRMADRWAAAAMMAGHPNDASPLGLRNIGFTIHVGGKDSAYHRNEVAASWKKQLAKLREGDPEGYAHEVHIYPDKGHWMDREDAVALEWMARFTRDPYPRRVVWKQHGVTHPRFYWLAVPEEARRAGTEIIATYDDQTIAVETNAETELPMIVRLNDKMLDLDKPIKIVAGDKTLFDGRAARTIDVLARTLKERGDPRLIFAAEVPVSLAASDDDVSPDEASNQVDPSPTTGKQNHPQETNPMQLVNGIGGVFIFSDDPARLARWYEDHLGIRTIENKEEDNYYCMFVYRQLDDPDRKSRTVWAIMQSKVKDGAAPRQFQINYRVNDLDAVIEHLKANHVAIEKVEDYDYGRFAWAKDCDGNRIELFEEKEEL